MIGVSFACVICIQCIHVVNNYIEVSRVNIPLMRSMELLRFTELMLVISIMPLSDA